jgi:hypothetical protein
MGTVKGNIQPLKSHHGTAQSGGAHFETYHALIREYCNLAIQPNLTEDGIERQDEILAKAEGDPLLEFLLDEADHLLGHALGFIDSRLLKDQQQQLESLIDRSWLMGELSKYRDRRGQVPPVFLRDAQTCLKREGLYRGAVDGVYGNQTRKAFRQLRRRVQQLLSQQGLYSGSLDEMDDTEQERLINALRQQGKARDAKKIELLNLESWFLSSIC